MAKVVAESNAIALWEKHELRSLWQHPCWQKFQEAVGRECWIASHGDAYALVVKRKLPFGKCWLEIPRGPLYKTKEGLDGILKELKELAKKEKAIFIRMSPYDDSLVPKGTVETKLDHHPETSLVLDLSLDDEALLKQMKPKGRYNIKVAEKHQVHVRESEEIDEFYELLEKTTNRDGFAAHPKGYYRKMLEELGQYSRLFVAAHNGTDKVIAAGIFVYIGDWAIYYYGASDHHHRKLMAPYLVQWHAIKEAKRQECKYFDFLGIAPEGAKNHPWKGVTDFKKKFGGEVLSYPQARDLVISKHWYKLYTLRKKMK